MRILFITSSRLGDAVLSTGLLDHLIAAHPGAQVTIVCGKLPASLFEGVPGQKRIVTLAKRKWNLHWLDLWRNLRRERWDIIVDLRDSIVSRLLPARGKYIYSRHIDQKLHKVEQNAAVLRLASPPSPRLWPTAAQTAEAERLVPPGGPVLGIGPTANWIGKTWPAENFIALIVALTAPGGVLPGARVAIFAAPGEESAARQVLASVPPDRRIDVIAKADPGTAAAALGRCALYVGNDSGLMHCAAAMGIPTLGLFGPSWPHLYRPWGRRVAMALTRETYAELIGNTAPSAVATSLMTSLPLDAVITAAEELYRQYGSGLTAE